MTEAGAGGLALAMAITVQSIHRYALKGLPGETLERTELAPGEGLPHDRRFAMAHGTTQFDPRNPEWMPKTNFLMLMKDEKLAKLRTRFEPETGRLSIERDGKQVVCGTVTESMGRTLINQFFASYMAGATRGAPKLVEAEGHRFFDIPEKTVSIINLASVRDLERVARQSIDPLRFRANVYIEGAAAWEEFGWVDRKITLGGAGLEVAARIDRCAATHVNPATAERDLNVVRFLKAGFGHIDMGIYARVVSGGPLAVRDALTLA